MRRTRGEVWERKDGKFESVNDTVARRASGPEPAALLPRFLGHVRCVHAHRADAPPAVGPALLVPCAGVSVQTTMDSLAMEQQVQLGPRALPPASSPRTAPLCLPGHACPARCPPPPSPPLARSYARTLSILTLCVALARALFTSSRATVPRCMARPSPCLVVQELLLRSQDNRQMSSKQVCAEARPAPLGSQRRLTPVSLLPERLPWTD